MTLLDHLPFVKREDYEKALARRDTVERERSLARSECRRLTEENELLETKLIPLMRAVARTVLRKRPEARNRYTLCVDFDQEMVEAALRGGAPDRMFEAFADHFGRRVGHEVKTTGRAALRRLVASPRPSAVMPLYEAPDLRDIGPDDTFNRFED